MFVIRNQGFFYTDEYYAAGEVFKNVARETFETKAAAESACAALIREWVRSEPLGNYLFDDGAAIANVLSYLRETWPEDLGDIEWEYELYIPEEATDHQVDEIVKRMNVTFAQVFEVEEDDQDDQDDEEEPADYEDDLYFGPG